MSNVTRRLQVPDMVRVHRYKSLPELAPSILFFSGGSALNKIARCLKSYTHHSVHMVTPFDSGGSSAKLRSAFNMPAVGDLRSRLMALADETVLGQPSIYDLFSYRLSESASEDVLSEELAQLAAGTHPLMQSIVAPMKTLIQTPLAVLQQQLPNAFDLRGASVGNLIIAGGYLSHLHLLDPIIFLFSRLVKTLGQVSTIVNGDYHLGVELIDGTYVIGQHLITGKETQALSLPIARIWLNQGLANYQPISVALPDDRRQQINQADLICYSPGSFFTSIVANLLVEGVSDAIQSNPNPKVYLPNLGIDTEQQGWSLMARIRYLLTLLVGEPTCNQSASVLDWVLLDATYDYGEVDEAQLRLWGVEVIRAPLREPLSHHYDEKRVTEALLSFA